MTANIPELFADVTIQQKPDVPGNPTEGADSQNCSMLAIPETMADNGKAQSSDSTKIFDTKEHEASVSIVAEHESNTIAEDAVIANDEPERKGLTESDVVDIARQLAETLQEKGQHVEANDDGPQLTRVRSRSSSTYESTVDGADVQQEERRMKDGWSQVSSPPRCMSRALQAVQKMCDAEVQTQGWDPALFNELMSTVQKHDAEVAELKGKLESLRESHATEVRELRNKIGKLLQTPPTEPTRSAAEEKNCAAEKEKPTGTNGQDTLVSLRPPQPQPSTQLRQRDPLPLPRPEPKERSLPVDPSPGPLPPPDRVHCRRHATPPPVSDFPKLPGSKREVAAPCSHVESVHSSEEESPRKKKMERQILKIVRMVQKKRPDCTEEEIRKLVDHMRRSQGGFSCTTFNDIVALLLRNLKALPQE
ncbi:uncharacterized protein [Dermacentor albipictus]|uniref:uncharacterized protein n=1 Tax=Dermacentor albipictus TaxID=60249 RepID=UPI0031FD4218